MSYVVCSCLGHSAPSSLWPCCIAGVWLAPGLHVSIAAGVAVNVLHHVCEHLKGITLTELPPVGPTCLAPDTHKECFFPVDFLCELWPGQPHSATGCMPKPCLGACITPCGCAPMLTLAFSTCRPGSTRHS